MFLLSFRLGTSSLLQNIRYLNTLTAKGSKYRVKSSIKKIQSAELSQIYYCIALEE